MNGLAAFWPFRPSRADRDAERLLGAVVQIARQPNFYGPDRAPDTLDGRLEIMMLHASLALIRLSADKGVEPLAQAFTDRLFRHFDSGLREAAVGDTTVPKRMRKIARSFYGRLGVYAGAVQAKDSAGLEEAVARNVFNAEPGHIPFAGVLAAYAGACAATQASAPVDTLFRLDGWTAAPT